MVAGDSGRIGQPTASSPRSAEDATEVNDYEEVATQILWITYKLTPTALSRRSLTDPTDHPHAPSAGETAAP
ncbi:hypothetical protein DF220_00205 [Salinibacterium hongtaonis]|uniref:Uncharacterized protein n=1 Tax=Homoserinimonas hongtaonis TaxID=2079791 RepID=A0A2U1SXW0_9MICO|nr:hypothetical protein DF220_00205 [Salinibacterium hongtaonis]